MEDEPIDRPRTSSRAEPRRCGEPVRAAGFTFVELMITLALLALLVDMAAPSFANLIDDRRQTALYNRLASDLRLARLEAIKRGGDVSVCARAGATSCGDDWSAGWLVFTEKSAAEGGNGGVLDADERLVASRPAATDISIVATATVRPAGAESRSFIRFDGRGRADWSAGTFVLCDARGEGEALGLVVGGAGGFRSAYEPPDGDGVVLDARGSSVTCSS